MITTTATTTEHSLVISFTRPDGKKIPTANARDEAEMMRLIYFYNRLYIAEKLRGWLMQRSFAMNMVGDNGRCTVAQNLLANLHTYNQGSLHQLTAWVRRQEPNIRLLAPGDQSKHFKAYEGTIVPILTFCSEMKGPGQ